jgi:Tfp pilus assembly pilus retraction ATPase PilT
MTEDWQKIVEFVHSTNASDISLNRGLVKARVDGKVVRLSSPEDFTDERFEALIRALFDRRPDLLPSLEEKMPSLDFSVSLHGMRFRANIVRAQGKLTAALRPLPDAPPDQNRSASPKR